MSIFHNGALRTIKANYTVREGDLRVIRPLVYVREKSTREFADVMHLPVIPENCPGCFEAPKERYRYVPSLGCTHWNTEWHSWWDFGATFEFLFKINLIFNKVFSKFFNF